MGFPSEQQIQGQLRQGQQPEDYPKSSSQRNVPKCTKPEERPQAAARGTSQVQQPKGYPFRISCRRSSCSCLLNSNNSSFNLLQHIVATIAAALVVVVWFFSYTILGVYLYILLYFEPKKKKNLVMKVSWQIDFCLPSVRLLTLNPSHRHLTFITEQIFLPSIHSSLGARENVTVISLNTGSLGEC